MLVPMIPPPTMTMSAVFSIPVFYRLFLRGSIFFSPMGKNGTAEYAETAEFFSKRRKTGMIVYLFPALCVLPYLCGLCFFSPLGSQALPLPGSSVHENKRMNEEEAEKAEAPSDKNWMVFGGPGNAGKAGD
jgi:hypothetical protein